MPTTTPSPHRSRSSQVTIKMDVNVLISLVLIFEQKHLVQTSFVFSVSMATCPICQCISCCFFVVMYTTVSPVHLSFQNKFIQFFSVYLCKMVDTQITSLNASYLFTECKRMLCFSHENQHMRNNNCFHLIGVISGVICLSKKLHEIYCMLECCTLIRYQ